MSLLGQNSISPLRENRESNDSSQNENNNKFLKLERIQKKTIVLISISIFISLISITAISISIAYLAGIYILFDFYFLIQKCNIIF